MSWNKKTTFVLFILSVIIHPVLFGQVQTQADSYTRYELLEPENHSFRIIYDVSATTAGAKYYWNTLRAGSEHQVDHVYDRMSGEELPWKIVDGTTAKQNGHERANPKGEYLQVQLPRIVPDGGEIRLRIDKTYADGDSYYKNGDQIIFTRSLGIKRNAVVLPAGYELITCNYPSQVMQETDGRIKTSFFNRGPSAVPYQVTAKPLSAEAKAFQPSKEAPPWGETADGQGVPSPFRARLDYTFTERAFQDREIVYFLQQPETHSFRLYHDYTEIREGVDKYLNVVRAGSKASNPSAIILDTGEKLKVETLRGEEITTKGITLSSPITEKTEVVAIWFDPVKKGQSVRLRIEETYTDPNRYLLYRDELVWDRYFGRPQNTVILPDGWYLTTSSIPAVIDQTDDGRTRLYFVNDRQGNIQVFLKGRRR